MDLTFWNAVSSVQSVKNTDAYLPIVSQQGNHILKFKTSNLAAWSHLLTL